MVLVYEKRCCEDYGGLRDITIVCSLEKVRVVGRN